MKQYSYKTKIRWDGNKGLGTINYSAYGLEHLIWAKGKYSPIHGSSDPSFRGDATMYNPEELFLSSLSSCHMLWYMHLCASNKITVLSYTDDAEGTMMESAEGSGRFTNVCLNPNIVIAEDDKLQLAIELHKEANKLCFIANSCNSEIHHKPKMCVQNTI